MHNIVETTKKIGGRGRETQIRGRGRETQIGGQGQGRGRGSRAGKHKYPLDQTVSITDLINDNPKTLQNLFF